MDRRSFPTTTDTSKLAGAVDPAAALKDLDSRNNPHSTIRVTTRFSGGELRQHQMNSNISEPSTCPRLRAQAATFALILDQSRLNSQLIGTALTSQSSAGLHFHDTRLLRAIDRPDETVAAAGQRFDETRIFCRVSQHVANLVDRGIQVVVYIDKGVGPQSLLQFLTGHHLARPLQ